MTATTTSARNTPTARAAGSRRVVLGAADPRRRHAPLPRRGGAPDRTTLRWSACARLEALLTPDHRGSGAPLCRRWSPELAFACDRASHLQLNRYEPQRHGRELLTDAHEDGLYLTLLFADAPGLEVLTPDGRWRPVQPRRGELIAMPGEIFSLLCGYRVQPLCTASAAIPRCSGGSR